MQRHAASRFAVLALGDPHPAERVERRQDGATKWGTGRGERRGGPQAPAGPSVAQPHKERLPEPCGVLALRGRHDLNLHVLWREFAHLKQQAVAKALEERKGRRG